VRKQGADPKDPDEYRAGNIFWVPKEAPWAHLKASALQPKIGQIVDEAMAAIERDDPSLKAARSGTGSETAGFGSCPRFPTAAPDLPIPRPTAHTSPALPRPPSLPPLTEPVSASW